ncbi:MAG: hypothetical protein ACR2RV_06640 [Verrucomicrobiales bacterium]
MRSSPRLLLAALVALSLIACSSEEPLRPPPPDSQELDAKEAAVSFKEHVGTEFGRLELWRRTSSAIIRETKGSPGKQITYVLPGQGGMVAVTAVLEQLSRTCTALDDERCWMPWEKFIDLKINQPGPFMGSFRAENSQLALWIDQYGRNLFVCYQTPAPEPEPEPEPVEEPEPEPVEEEEPAPPLGEQNEPATGLPAPIQ